MRSVDRLQVSTGQGAGPVDKSRQFTGDAAQLMSCKPSFRPVLSLSLTHLGRLLLSRLPGLRRPLRSRASGLADALHGRQGVQRAWWLAGAE